MTPKEFINAYLDDAKECEKATGIHHVATLTQAALETGWAKAVPGNMFFGIKAKSTDTEKQLITTREVLKTPNAKFPVILSVTKNANGTYTYKVKDWFRKYKTPADSFKDHSKFFFENPRYKNALAVRGDYNKWFEELQKAGYATDPNYANTLKAVAKTIIKNL
jgi:flagellar protein FlgJ